jgi:hypothetical protein
MSTVRRRQFQEVRDNLLTAITGGVAAEAHPFPPPGRGQGPFRYSLLKPPVAEITSVYGTRNRESHLFRAGIDYQLIDAQTLAWPAGKGAETPDVGTVFEVNYRPRAAGAVVTDIYTGSVVRTTAESIALEIARLYAQLQAVYDAGFIDTATGRSLENLVRVLDLERVEGGRAAGEVVFERSAGSTGSVSIPAGTRIMTADGKIEYETVAAVALSESQSSVRVVARDIEPNEAVAAGALSVLPVPIAGIGAVSNPAPTAISTADESDEELRTRAKSFLHGSERGTLGAIRQALLRQGVQAEVTEILSGDDIDRVEVTPHVEAMTDELEQRLRSAIERVRPAGVVVRLVGALAPKSVDLALRFVTADGLLEEDRRALQRNVQAQLSDYLAGLPATEPASINRIVGLVLGNAGVQDVTLLAASLHDTAADGTALTVDVLDREGGRLDIGAAAARPGGFPKKLGDLKITDPGLPTHLDVVVTVPAGEAPPPEETIRGGLTGLLASVNNANAAEPAAGTTPAVSFDQLSAATPLPAGPSYGLEYVLTTETGVSEVLDSTGQSYTLTPFERLSLRSVEIVIED